MHVLGTLDVNGHIGGNMRLLRDVCLRTLDMNGHIGGNLPLGGALGGGERRMVSMYVL
jgi:hypothetical protein